MTSLPAFGNAHFATAVANDSGFSMLFFRSFFDTKQNNRVSFRASMLVNIAKERIKRRMITVNRGESKRHNAERMMKNRAYGEDE